MNKYKVVVYAISKNEEKFVKRWYESMKEADYIYVLDTGSTDNTVRLLKNLGVNVVQKTINPWRFDKARNASLDLVPLDTDICVCTDLDEVFNPGWRKSLESSWDYGNRLKYVYNWSLNEDNKPIISFMYEKIHSRLHYKWIYPVHEILECNLDNEIVHTCKDIILNHYPDNTKSRSSYLPLLKLAYKENPSNDRILHYLGREYMYYGKYQDSIDTLIKHVNFNGKTWDLEKCASMRFISRCYSHLNRLNEAKMWAKKAINICPYIREGYLELAFIYFNENNFLDCIFELIKAKTIHENEMLYINEPWCFNETIDDLLSICYANLNLKDEAIFYVNKAIDINNKDNRLKNNKKIFENIKCETN